MSKSKNNAVLYPDNKKGIYLYEYPVINGIKQYVQLRGADRKNPLILFLHGGPGGSLAGLCHVLQAGWEEKFTVANWDQRNACKTYFANKDKAEEIAKTGTMEDFIKDIDGVIAYLHTVYDFEKLILIGFSWGSAIGSEYAKRHPENLLCYIGVGQLTNYREGALFTCRKLLELTPEGSKDEEKVKRMIETFPKNPLWDKELMTCMRYYTPLCIKYIAKHTKRVPYSKIFGSPFLNFKEKLSVIKSDFTLLERTLTTMMTYDFRENMSFKVPVLFVFGEEDFSCPTGMLEDCFDNISAPVKKLAIIPKAAHTCFYDRPQEFMRIISEFICDI